MSQTLTLSHIKSLRFALSHLVRSSGDRSARLLLTSLPSAPSPKHPAVPEVEIRTTDGPSCVEVTYADKKAVKFDTAGEVRIGDLLRKVDAPARALRMKEEGL